MKNKYLEESSDSESDDEVDIHDIAKNGTYEEMEWALVKNKLTLCFSKDKTGRSALHYACDLGRMDMAKLLIIKGSDVNARDANEDTPLLLASSKSEADIIRMLVSDYNANIKAKNLQSFTCLHFASINNDIDIAIFLIEHGVDINGEDHKSGKTALHYCAESGYDDLCEELIVLGANICASGDKLYSRTPLHLASVNGHVSTVRVIASRKGEVDALCGLLDKSPLHLACECGYQHVAKVLLQFGADINLIGLHTNGASPLHLACMNHHIETADFLVRNGASINQQGKFTCRGTPLHIACVMGFRDVVELLISHGAILDQRDKLGFTPLHTACEAGEYDIASFLISLDASLEFKTNFGKSPLQLVENSLSKEKLRLDGQKAEEKRQIIINLANIKIAEEKEIERQKNLAEEIRQKRENELMILRELTRAKFKILLRSACDISGELSALSDIAMEFPDQDINIVIIDEDQSTALHRVCRHGFLDLAIGLLHWPNINVNLLDVFNNSPLAYAAMCGYREIIEILLLFPGIKTGTLNTDGFTPANLAKSDFLREIIRNPKLIEKKTTMKIEKHSSKISLVLPWKNDTTSLFTLDTYPDEVNGLASTVPKSLTMTDSSKLQGPLTPSTPSAFFPNTPCTNQSFRSSFSLPSPLPQLGKYNTSIRDIKSNDKPNSQIGQLDENSIDQFSRNKFGVMPVTFGGCRSDMFFSLHLKFQDLIEQELSSKSKLAAIQPGINHFKKLIIIEEQAVIKSKIQSEKSQIIEMLGNNYESNKFHQSVHVPASFEKTEEWLDSKDFLWLFGYPFKPRFQTDKSGLKSVAHLSVGESVNWGTTKSPLKSLSAIRGNPVHFVKDDANSPMRSSPVMSSRKNSKSQSFFGDLEFEDNCLDRRYIFHRIAITMDIVQEIFTHPDSYNLTSHKKLNFGDLPASYQHKYCRNDDKFMKSFFFDMDEGSMSSMSLGDQYSRLLAAECTDFVANFVDIFEPIGGWPQKVLSCKESNLWERTGLLQYGQVISYSLMQQLYKLLEYGGKLGSNTGPVPSNCNSSQNSVDDDSFGPMVDLPALGRGGNSIYVTGDFVIPPRHRRVILDHMFEIAEDLKSRIECHYPVDSIRAQLWLHNGKTLFAKNNFNSSRTPAEYSGITSAYDHNESIFKMWLSDIKLSEYEGAFREAGFKIISDFEGLSSEDVLYYFPFIRLGDARRLSKHVHLINTAMIESYRQRAMMGDAKIPPPPVPTMLAAVSLPTITLKR